MKVFREFIELWQSQRPPTNGASADSLRSYRSEAKWNFVSTFAVLFSTAVELGLREAFYSISSQTPVLLLIAILALLTALMAWRFPARHAFSRVMALVAVFAWWQFAGIGWQWVESWRGWLLLGLCVGAVRLGASRWAALCRAWTVAILIFVLSQPLLAYWRAPDLQWPPTASSKALVPEQPEPETMVVVLLDELSAKAAGPIAAAMGRSGHPVLRRAIKPSGENTGQVVPSMLARREFEEAKPCSWRTVCSNSDVLDLGRVTASRPDIDIVGFYFPYCDIKGLRSCTVVSPQPPYLDMSRWRCAAQRRAYLITHFDGEAQRLRCAEQLGQVWATLGKGVEAAIWQAPLWSRGGVLYAHVPLPHPPGVGSEGSLELHYRANIAEAATLIGAIAERLASTKRPFSLVVFSDHPLRPGWCKSVQYRDSCPPSADLLDDRVPLLATGVVHPAFEGIQSNMEIFSLVGASR